MAARNQLEKAVTIVGVVELTCLYLPGPAGCVSAQDWLPVF
ncbi:MAG: hypothetical protein AB2827_05160 [Candidatus Thiodiazotropha sp.]